MKIVSILVLFLVCTSGYVIKITDLPVLRPNFAPSGWIHLQKVVLPLFENVCEESTNEMIVRLSGEFLKSPGEFWDANVLTNLQNLKTGKGFLQKGEIFSEYNSEHLVELKIVFDVLYGAKNFDTFIKAAAWARQNINCGLYVDALYLAFENRRDTEKLTLPPPYELLPNYFIRKDIIIQGSSLLAGQDINPSEGVRDEGNAYTLHANYTANFYDNNDESKLAYFREDVGLNTHYFLTMLKLSPWLNRDIDINNLYGENLYHIMKQWAARYNMERYSNGMLDEEDLNWDTLSNSVYDPMLVYSNGNEFIYSLSSMNTNSIDDKSLLKTIEENLPTVVLHMRDSGYNKTQILNHLMEILVTSEKSYNTLARRVLGNLSNNGNPSVLEHYMTSMRDPLFWKLNKKIVDIVDNSLRKLPPYSKNELYFPGVEIVSVEAKKIMTNFDYFQFDITDALKIGNGDTTFQVKIGQTRLNHKPFSIKVNISSLVTQKGLVKIYVGPKIMPGEFPKKKNQFGLLDYFEVNLKRGSNVITRSSSDNIEYTPDFLSYRTLVKKVEDAQFGLYSLPLNSMEKQTKFPDRLIIPKGTPEGLPLQMLVFVAPYMKAKVGGVSYNSKMEFNNAVLSKLYPMDLIFEDNMLLDLPNVLMREISITHKGSGGGKPSTGTAGDQKGYKDYNPSSRPNYGNDYSNNYYNSNEEQNQNLQFVQFDFIAPRNDNQNKDFSYEEQNDRPSSELRPKLELGSEDASKKSFDYKSKRPDYKSLYKNTSTTETPEGFDNEEMSEKNVLNEKYIKNQPIEDIIVVEENNDRNEEEQDFKISSEARPKLYQYNPDYGNRKPFFNYKPKRPARPQYNKVDYKSLYKNKNITTTELPEEFDNNKMGENNAVDENKINHQLDENSLYFEDNDSSGKNLKGFEEDRLSEIIKNDLKENNLVVKPLLKLIQSNSKSFYETIRSVLDDYDENKFEK